MFFHRKSVHFVILSLTPPARARELQLLELLDMGDDLYATLGVESSASEDDIRRAYRRLSMTYHPDRRLDPEEQRAAAPLWLRISSAYDVLADSRKRMVYDELGPEHLQQGLAVLSDKVMTPDELHREWRRTKARAAESDHFGRMGINGSIVLSASVQRLLQPDDVHMPLWRRCVPELSSVAMDQEMTMRLDPKNSLTLSNQAVTKHGLGGSTLRLGFKRTLSPRSTLQLSTSLSHEPYALGLPATRLGPACKCSLRRHALPTGTSWASPPRAASRRTRRASAPCRSLPRGCLS